MDHIKFHDDLHGFLSNRGTGMACLEAKLEAQLAIITGWPLHHIYLDFAKAYDSLNRERTLILTYCYRIMAWAPTCCASYPTFGTATLWYHANRQSSGTCSWHNKAL